MLIDPRDGWLLHVQCPCLGTTLLQASARWFREVVTFALQWEAALEDPGSSVDTGRAWMLAQSSA